MNNSKCTCNGDFILPEQNTEISILFSGNDGGRWCCGVSSYHDDQIQ